MLQTSTPELALRDTQNEVLALDLRPEAFRTSTDDAVNIRRLTLREVAPMRQTRFVASVWDRENDRISDSPMDEGRKVITFNAILKYNTFPLADIVRDILRLGVEEMRCPVEVEFAVNMDVPYGQRGSSICCRSARSSTTTTTARSTGAACRPTMRSSMPETRWAWAT